MKVIMSLSDVTVLLVDCPLEESLLAEFRFVDVPDFRLVKNANWGISSSLL